MLRFPVLRRWLRIGALLLATLLVLLAASTWLLPRWLHSHLPEMLGQALGRTVHVQAVSWQPWRLALALQGLQIDTGPNEPAGRPALLRLASVEAQLSPQALFTLQPVLASLQAQGLQVHLVRNQAGQLNLQDILDHLAAGKQPDTGHDEPAAFALRLLKLEGAALSLEDQALGQTHVLSELALQVTQLSRLPADANTPAQASLRGKLQGAALALDAQGLPFAATPSADVHLKLQGLPWQPYLGYLPAGLPVRVVAGQLSLDMAATGRLESGLPTLSAKGQVSLDQVTVNQADGQPLAQWAALSVPIQQLAWPAMRIDLGELRWDGLRAHLRRDARGQWAGLPPSPAPAAAAPASATPTSWQVALAALHLNQAQLAWHDQAVPGGSSVAVSAIQLDLKAVRWPAVEPWPISLQAQLINPARPAEAPGPLSVSGQVHPNQASLKLQADGLDLSLANPYLAGSLRARLSGRASVQGQLDWAAGDAPRLQVSEAQVGLRTLRLDPPGDGAQAPAPWRLDRLDLGPVSVDMVRRQVSVAQVSLSGASADLARDAQGQLNVQTWLAPSQAGQAPAGPQPPARPWQVQVGSLQWDKSQVQWRDAMAPTRAGQPLSLTLQGIRGSASHLAWPPQAGAQATSPMELNAQLAAPSTTAGPAAPPAQLGWSGRIGAAPWSWDGQLRVQQWPLHRLAAYLDASLPVRLRRAELSFQGPVRGQLAPAGLSLAAKGQMRLTDWRIQARPGALSPDDAGDELLSWQSLALQNLDLQLAPARRPSLAIQGLVLDDFFARLLITEQGDFNLAAVTDDRPHDGAGQQASTPEPAKPLGAAPAPDGSNAADKPGLPLDLAIGRTQIRNGRVDFTDHFIRPHYSAQLSDLQGEIGALDSSRRDMAAVKINGRVADTALLAIEGRSNPFVSPPALDVKAHVTELELAPLTPYAIKYAGYGIERGKLSVNLGYKVDETGKLDASNQIILNQLTFGDKVDSPTATSLPVRLAVTLLKDRNGVIDVNLPVSGSLQDPQFSVGGIVFKLVVNLVGKALTAPFSLLAGGDNTDLSLVEFVPGTPTPTAAGQAALAKVAQALLDRPELAMTVMGVADPLAEHDGLVRALLNERLRTEHRRLQLRVTPMQIDGPSPQATESAITPAERAALLHRLYRQTPLPDKPRNLFGLAVDVSAEEAEKRLLAATRINEDQARQLALQRGLAVRDALVSHGLPSTRLFLAAPKVRASGEDDAAWTPRVELTLSQP